MFERNNERMTLHAIVRPWSSSDRCIAEVLTTVTAMEHLLIIHKCFTIN